MPRTGDLAAVRSVLETDRGWSVYALGDLAPGLAERCDWHVSDPGGPALVMLYRGFATPVLFAIGEPDAVAPLLDEVAGEPAMYLHVRPAVIPLLKRRYRLSDVQKMRRMLLDPSKLPPDPGGEAARLGPSDLGALRRLYADGEPAGEAPGFFSPSMLDDGAYFGAGEGGELVAAAGTHLVVPAVGVGAIGNVYTRRDRRGLGLGGRLTRAVAAELLRRGLTTVALNVNDSNTAAWRVYERLGFAAYCP